jgi:hypothetical protein
MVSPTAQTPYPLIEADQNKVLVDQLSVAREIHLQIGGNAKTFWMTASIPFYNKQK